LARTSFVQGHEFDIDNSWRRPHAKRVHRISCYYRRRCFLDLVICTIVYTPLHKILCGQESWS
jgi:hypothetical protein